MTTRFDVSSHWPNTTMSHLDEFNPLPAYILAPLTILQKRVTAEIALVIIDYAELWQVTTVVRDLRGRSSSAVKGTARTKETPFLSESVVITSKLDTSVVRKIVFRTQSHDQGDARFMEPMPHNSYDIYLYLDRVEHLRTGKSRAQRYPGFPIHLA